MARNDGIDRTFVRNRDLKDSDIAKTQEHNEREKDTYQNTDIVTEQTHNNVHFKSPTGNYAEMFAEMEANKIISTRGLKDDAFHYGELIFDVNSAYFHNHGGYEFAKQFYADAYQAAVEIVGGEQYILSAVMHADERNRAMSEALGEDVYHYHLHVVYVPVVEKQILWSKRCKDKALVGTVKETIMQVSRSKKWQSQPAQDEEGNPILNKKGKTVLRPSYAVLQDDFFHAMQAAGYTDLQRGERGSTEEHLTVTQFKVQQEQQRLLQLQEAAELAEVEKEEAEIKAKQAREKLNEVAPKLKQIEKLAADFSEDPERLLPQPAALESAKTYREKKAKPLVQRMVKVLRSVYRAYLDMKSKYEKLSQAYNKECIRTAGMAEQLDALRTENRMLKETVAEYDLVKSNLGAGRISEIIKAAKQGLQQKKHREHTRWCIRNEKNRNFVKKD